MDEPPKKKPRKSKLVPGTYVDLAKDILPETAQPPMQLSVNVKVEQCDDNDWLTEMLEAEKLNDTAPKKMYTHKRRAVKIVKATEGDKIVLKVEKSVTGPSTIESQNLPSVSTEDVDTQEKDNARKEGKSKVILKRQSIDKEVTEDNISSPATPDNEDTSSNEPKKKKRVNGRKGRGQSRTIAMCLELPVNPGAHCAAVDITVTLDAGYGSLLQYYRAMLEDAQLMSPYSSRAGYGTNAQDSTENVICKCSSCRTKQISRKELEQHLVQCHPLKRMFVVVQPGMITVSCEPPKDKPFLADMENGHIAYYCMSYEDAAWSLAMKWGLVAARDKRRRPDILCYKCYDCRKHYFVYSQFIMHLKRRHDNDERRVVLLTEMVAGGYANMVATYDMRHNYYDPRIFKTSNGGFRCYRCRKTLSSEMLLDLHRKNMAVCKGCNKKMHCNELVKHQGFCDLYLDKYYPKECQCKIVLENARELSLHKKKCLYNTTLAYNCIVCKFISPDYNTLVYHQGMEHHVRSDIFAQGVKVQICNDCNSKFSGSIELHVCPKRTVSYACDVCDFHFQTKKLLDVHRKAYEGVEKCNECGASLTGCGVIEHRITKHETIFKLMYECPICKVAFDDLQKNKDSAHDADLHRNATWGGVRMKLNKIYVYKDPESLKVYPCKQNAFEKGPSTSSDKVAIATPTEVASETATTSKIIKISKAALATSSFILIAKKRGVKKTYSQVKVYGGPVPQGLTTRKESGDRTNPGQPTVECVGTNTGLKIIEKVNTDAIKNEVLVTNDKEIDQSLEKIDSEVINKEVLVTNNKGKERPSKIVDKIVFEDDDNSGIEIGGCVEVKSSFGDIGDGENDNVDMANTDKTNELINDETNELINDKTNELINDKPNELINDKTNESNENESDIVKVKIEKTDEEEQIFFEVGSAIKTEPMTEDANKEDDDVNFVIEVQPLIQDAKSFQIEKTIKQEVVELITNIKTEPEDSVGCSFATEVSIDKVLETNCDITYVKNEPEEYAVNENLVTPEKNERVCTKCNFRGSESDFKNHLKQCKAKPSLTYKCLRCVLECFDLRDYLKHLTLHGYLKMQCPACKKIQLNNQKLAEHVLKHIKGDFRKITYIDNSKKDQLKKFRCNHCRSVLSQTEFFVHWQTHFNDAPKDNIQESKDNGNISSITNEQLDELVRVIQTTKKLKVRNCCICDREFSRMNDFKRHFIEHLLTHALSMKIVYKNLKCQICSEVFKKPDSYKKHMRDHALLPLYQCQICDKAFSDSSNFGKHKKVHNLYVFVCDICNKKFQCKLMLEKHIVSHGPAPRPQQCSLCPRTFFCASALRKHERMHRNTNSYKCTFCLLKYSSLRQKWIHEWQVHQERKFDGDCPICNKSFRTFAETRAHMKAAHRLQLNSFEFTAYEAMLSKKL